MFKIQLPCILSEGEGERYYSDSQSLVCSYALGRLVTSVGAWIQVLQRGTYVSPPEEMTSISQTSLLGSLLPRAMLPAPC